MSSSCFDKENCNNAVCQEEIANSHEISEDAFDAMVAAFFGADPVPAPLTLSATALETLVDVDCAANRIVFTVPATTNTQQDISVEVESGYDPMDNAYHNYSVALFRGLLLKEPDEIGFYKARSEYGTTLAMKLVKDRAVIYIGNVSDAYP